MYADGKHDRYVKECSKCGQKFPSKDMISLAKVYCCTTKQIGKVCEDCYIDLLDFLNIKDKEII